MIQVNSLSKGFAHQNLFSDITFTIHKGEKIGLVGRNGCGKTTLLRILAGIENPDNGSVFFPRGYRVAYLQQEITFTHSTVLEECLASLPEGEYPEAWKAEKLLFGLDFTPEMLQQNPSELSGGWMNRLSLAKTLITDADMLLFDEPTNHLDLPTLAWLTEFLKSWRKEFILITHDRFFMNNVVTHTIAIHRQQMKKMKGDVDKIYEQITIEEEVYEKTRMNDEKERAHIEKFISRFRAQTNLRGMVQSRIKMLQKMKKADRLVAEEDLEFKFNFTTFETRGMMDVKDISFGYEKNHPLVQHLSFPVDKGDRIAFIGRSGKGKTTLLRVIAGDLAPWSGKIAQHPLLLTSYYGQITERTLHPDHTVEEEIMLATEPRNPKLARAIAGAMLFDGPMALKKVKVLSGGEKARVQLGKIIARPTHCLLLDEPSNHLDMQSTDSLIEALDAFTGAVIFVSHNEMILHALATKLVVFDADGLPYYFDGTYQDFLEQKGFSQPTKKEESKKSIKLEKKEKAESQKERRQRLKVFEDKIKEWESLIKKQEARTKEIHDLLIEAAQNSESDQIAALSKEAHLLEGETANSYEQLFAEQEAYEEAQKE
ncbi:MAG: ABC-F family ATP-binding cassette domain-containing protein [Brevinema sp.]